jgi:hypothetical protein
MSMWRSTRVVGVYPCSRGYRSRGYRSRGLCASRPKLGSLVCLARAGPSELIHTGAASASVTSALQERPAGCVVAQVHTAPVPYIGHLYEEVKVARDGGVRSPLTTPLPAITLLDVGLTQRWAAGSRYIIASEHCTPQVLTDTTAYSVALTRRRDTFIRALPQCAVLRMPTVQLRGTLRRGGEELPAAALLGRLLHHVS